jgi:hypothetical protein
MVLNVTKYDGSPLVSVQDSTLDTTTTSITLIGKNAVNYGLPMNENFVALMQHFANTSPPPTPIQGQIWYNSVKSSLSVFDGQRWMVVTPPFDGNAGTASIAITPTLEVAATLSSGNIISVTSSQYVPPADLADTVTIADSTYNFKSRFPAGLTAGITLAGTTEYLFQGTATSANVLTTARSISLSGSASGAALFDGSNDIVITSNLINVLNANVTVGNYYTKFQIASNGLITDSNVIIDQDVYSALGYTPPAQVVINGDAYGNSVANGTIFTVNVFLSNTTVSPGSYNNVTVDATGRVVAAQNDFPIPVKGIILWDDVLVPNGWAVCDGTSVTTPNGIITTPTIPSIGSVRYIMRVY